MYRGSGLRHLKGYYIFGDFAQAFFTPSGSLLFVEDPLDDNPGIQQFQIGNDDRSYGLFLKGFGEDEDGEIYVAGSTALAPTGNTGIVHRIVAPP